MSEVFQELMLFASSVEGKNKYPMLRKALLSLNELVGMTNVKESVADEIKTVLAYDILDKPNRTSPVQTRSRSRSLSSTSTKKKRKKNWSQKKKKKPKQNDETNVLVFGAAADDDEDDDEVPGNIADFLRQIESQLEDDCCSEIEPEESIRSKRMKDLKLHTLIMGPPGTGKTTLAHKLAAIWEAIGLVDDKFIAITKGHIASKWQGEALTTVKALINEYSNGVVFIDEAYSLVTDAKDSFGNEVLSYIIHAMTDPACTTTFIFAGYEAMIKGQLFGANEGLSRRFNSIFVMEKPTPSEMAKIFKIICGKPRGWKSIIPPLDLTKLFEQFKEQFKDSGGDVESLVLASYRAHVNRFFPSKMSQKVSIADATAGMQIFLKNKAKKKKNSLSEHMYL